MPEASNSQQMFTKLNVLDHSPSSRYLQVKVEVAVLTVVFVKCLSYFRSNVNSPGEAENKPANQTLRWRYMVTIYAPTSSLCVILVSQSISIF